MSQTRVVVGEPPRESESKPRYFGQAHDPDLVLVIYDTAAIDRINRNHACDGEEEPRLKKPLGKYALYYETGFTDSGIFGQVMLASDKYRDAAVWFNDFYDLPFAIRALRERYPDVEIPEQVSYIIDWPFNRGKVAPGSSVVITAPTPVPEPTS